MKVKASYLVLILLLGISASAQQSQQEQQLVQQLNESRRKVGLPALKANDRLTKAAREHSQKMAETRTLGHVLPDEAGVAERLAATGLHFSRSGENVGYNTDFGSIQSAFMKSPPHRKNILNPDYTLVGIGVAQGGDGVYWATQDFAHVIPQRTASQAEDLAAQSVDALRRRIGGKRLERIRVPELETIACNMAKSGRLNPQAVLALPGVRNTITYHNSRPEELPPSVESVVKDTLLARLAVAACQASNKSNPGGTYYVVMAFYSSPLAQQHKKLLNPKD